VVLLLVLAVLVQLVMLGRLKLKIVGVVLIRVARV
jgi:hypothetical protein